MSSLFCKKLSSNELAKEIQKVVVVVRRKEEKQYKVSYQVKWDDFYAYLYMDKKKDIEFDIGDKVEVNYTEIISSSDPCEANYIDIKKIEK